MKKNNFNYSREKSIMESNRLIFKKIALEDFEPLKMLMGDPRVMYAWEHTFSDAQVYNWINKQIEYYEQDNVGYFATYEKCSGAFIGQAGLHRFELDNLNGYEVCYMLSPQHWHKGFAAESIYFFSEYARNILGLSKLYAQIRTNNQPSVAVAENAGFKRHSIFVKHYNGKDMDHFLYAKSLNS
jgi:ribosomal-protein-alanine N-acetyltransferase